MDMIEKSRVIYESLHPKLKPLPPILSSDTRKIIHKIPARKSGRRLEGLPKLSGVVFAKALSNKNSERLAGVLDEVEWKYREKWAAGGDHYLLMKILADGLLPSSSWPQPSSEEPTALSKAFELAKQRGYKVPDKYLKDNSVPCGEDRFFAAATYMTITERFSGFRSGREESLWQQPWRKNISTITGQFVVPDLLVDWEKCPFVADQLWIIFEGGKDVRFVVIEVDGAHHLDAVKREEDRKRDLKFNALGYEVIRVNEVWCRIDPFRVVAEILCVIGLCSDFSAAMVGGNLSSPDDYICAACGRPMIRFWDDSIKEVFEGGDSRLVHKSCFDEMLEGIYQGDSQFSFSP